MRLGGLGTGSGKFFHGKETLILASFHNIQGGAFTQAGDGDKGRAELSILNDELCGLALVNVNRKELKAPEVIFVDNFQRGQQILVLIGGILVIVDGIDIGKDRVHALGHQYRIKATLLAAAVEISGVECQGVVDLKPSDTEGHHNVGHRMGLGEQVLDLLAGADVPVRYAGGNHFLLRSRGQSPALTDRFHDLEGPFLRHTAGDQVDHDIVTTANGAVHCGSLGGYQIPGIAQPHVGAMSIAGDPHQEIKLLRHGIQKHAPGKAGIEFRHRHSAGGA